MNRFIRELRRREVLRTAGLYVGICWFLVEASSVVLPTFNAPTWVLQAIIIAVFAGFPITLVLAWVYDFTSHGIEVQPDATDTIVAPIGSRKMDFVVIGVMAVALIFSIYLNITSGPAIVEEAEPVSILIADFDNETGNSLFDGLLEQALNIGIESAPNVTSFERNEARSIATRTQANVATLNVAAATLVAVREGIKLVLSGSIRPSGSGFELQVSGVDPTDSRILFEVGEKAKSAESVLQVIGDLSKEVREELGDMTLGSDTNPIGETFTAASLEAAKAYTTALQLAYEGKHVEAVEQYRRATELDPNFGRAFSGLALSEFKLGRTEKATEHWDTALSLMETMTERERLRTLGLYYASVTHNFANAVQSFTELVEKYPADAAGHNNLAVAAFLNLDFQFAAEEGRKLIDIYPTSQLYRSNFALYAMYAGEFAQAAGIATAMIEEDPAYGVPYLPLAMAAIDDGDLEAAHIAYQGMIKATTGTYRESLAHLGLADVAIFSGDFDKAKEWLAAGIKIDNEADNRSAAAVKNIALAEVLAKQGDTRIASDTATSALEQSAMISVKVPAALLYVDIGNIEAANSIAAELTSKLQPQSRAYGQMIQAVIARNSGDYVPAVDFLRGAAELADLWLVRFELGRTYLEAEFFAEALSELLLCDERRGEATAIFLDDNPSYRYLATLPYWTARAQQALGMQSSSLEGYQTFLSRRPNGEPLTDDARQRLHP